MTDRDARYPKRPSKSSTHPAKKAPLTLHIQRWLRRRSLGAAVGLTLLGLFVAAGLAWFITGYITIGGFTWEITSAGITRSQATQIALTMVAGAGAAVALVVSYRRHRQLEEGSFMERLGVAAAQLGDDKASVQFSGVYGLAALADESDPVRRQQVIDVLCGYLRLPYDPAISGKAGVQTQAEKITYKEDEDGVQKETTVTTAHKAGEREVRATIFRVIRDRLQPEAVNSWSDLRFDFTGAVIDYCELTRSLFRGGASFKFATFNGATLFRNVEFSGGEVSFFGAVFARGVVAFTQATFSGGRVEFLGASYLGAEVDFTGATFSGGNVDFLGNEFSAGKVSFRYAEFSAGEVNLANAGFSGGEVDFNEARFLGGEVRFNSPRSWDVPPLVPWSDGEEPPKGVQPGYWPPKVLKAKSIKGKKGATGVMEDKANQT